MRRESLMLYWSLIQHLQPLNEQQLCATAGYASLGSSRTGASHRKTEKRKFILARKHGFLLKLLLGKKMDQRVYLEFYCLSEHKFLSRRRSVSMQNLRPCDGKGLIANILCFLGATKGTLPPRKGQENAVAWASQVSSLLWLRWL